MYSLASNRQYFSIDLDDDYVTNKHQTFILTNDDLIYWDIHASLILSESCAIILCKEIWFAFSLRNWYIIV